VIYFGDSITELWRDGIVGIDPKDTLNRGYSGQTTSQMLVRFRTDVINLKPRIVHFMAGTNDLAGNTGPITFEKIKNNIRSITEFAQMHGIQVVIGSILPAKVFSWRPGMKPAQDIQTMNKWLKTYADNSGFIYVDYYSAMADAEGGLPVELSQDGVHPSPAGYAIMKNIAAAAMRQARKR
jgi:lysophospholipase L1-like esterase